MSRDQSAHHVVSVRMDLGQGQKWLPIEHNAIDALWVYCIKKGYWAKFEPGFPRVNHQGHALDHVLSCARIAEIHVTKFNSSINRDG